MDAKQLCFGEVDAWNGKSFVVFLNIDLNNIQDLLEMEVEMEGTLKNIV